MTPALTVARHFEGTNGLRNLALRRRRELLTTDTELSAMAAAANCGLRRIPKNGYNAPAAMGMPMML